MKFYESVYEEIRRTIGSKSAETGGLLFGHQNDFIIRRFVFDSNATVTGSTYEFNLQFLNPLIKAMWENEGLELLGFIHGHPPGISKLSQGDILCFKRQFKMIPIDKFLVPIVFSAADKEFKIFPHVIYKDDPQNYQTEKLEIIKEERGSVLQDFSRIEKAVNIDLLKKTRIVGVGAGGAFSLYQSLVRSGIGKLTVIDPDIVDESNLTRQGYDFHDLGLLKTVALGKKIKNINGDIDYCGYNQDVTRFTIPELDEIFGTADLFLFMTDSFKAQAFGNLLALKYGKPAIWAGFYPNSRCAEVVFTVPGLTPACYRCATSPRYEAHSKQIIDTTSHQNTIFHTQYLDSIIGMLIMAILHNNSKGYEFSNWFGKSWNRNLIQFRTHPDHSNEEGNLFHKAYSAIDEAHVFEPVFQEIEPEDCLKYEHPCPDCGGKGDLRISPKLISKDLNSWT